MINPNKAILGLVERLAKVDSSEQANATIKIIDKVTINSCSTHMGNAHCGRINASTLDNAILNLHVLSKMQPAEIAVIVCNLVGYVEELIEMKR